MKRKWDQDEKRVLFCSLVLIAIVNIACFASRSSDLIIALLVSEGIVAIGGGVIWLSYKIFPDVKD